MPVVPAVALVSPSNKVISRRGWDKMSSPAEFDAVFRNRCASQARFMRVLAKGAAGQAPHFGITVSKKVCKTAVGRNYIKRVVRELLTETVDHLSGLDVVVMLKERFTPQQFNEFRQEFLHHVNEIQKCRKSC